MILIPYRTKCIKRYFEYRSFKWKCHKNSIKLCWNIAYRLACLTIRWQISKDWANLNFTDPNKCRIAEIFTFAAAYICLDILLCGIVMDLEYMKWCKISTIYIEYRKNDAIWYRISENLKGTVHYWAYTQDTVCMSRYLRGQPFAVLGGICFFLKKISLLMLAF